MNDRRGKVKFLQCNLSGTRDKNAGACDVEERLGVGSGVLLDGIVLQRENLVNRVKVKVSSLVKGKPNV